MLTLILFTAPWCGACITFERYLSEKKITIPEGMRIIKVDTDKYPNIWTRYEIRGLPTFIIRHDGKEIARRVGMSSPTNFQKWLDKCLLIAE